MQERAVAAEGQTAVSLGIVLAKVQLAMTGSGYQDMVPRLVF